MDADSQETYSKALPAGRDQTSDPGAAQAYFVVDISWSRTLLLGLLDMCQTLQNGSGMLSDQYAKASFLNLILTPFIWAQPDVEGQIEETSGLIRDRNADIGFDHPPKKFLNIFVGKGSIARPPTKQTPRMCVAGPVKE